MRNPNKRLGAGPHGADEIKEHPFFDGVNWDRVYARGYKVEPPHIRNTNVQKPMAESIIEDLGNRDENKIPGWSFIHYGASEIFPAEDEIKGS